MTTVPPLGASPPPGIPEPPPTQQRGWLKWVLIGCGLLILLLIALFAAIWFGVTKATEGPERVAREFLQAAAEGDAARAHDTFSVPLKEAQSLEDLAAILQQNPALFATTDATFSDRNVDTSGAELSGTATLESGTEVPVSFSFVRENGEWKLIAWNIGR